MICPECKSSQIKCIDGRTCKDEVMFRRRRECIDCGHRWTTYEMPIDVKVNNESLGNCMGCFWCGKRSQKCSYCRRNPILKDCYEVG